MGADGRVSTTIATTDTTKSAPRTLIKPNMGRMMPTTKDLGRPVGEPPIPLSMLLASIEMVVMVKPNMVPARPAKV